MFKNYIIKPVTEGVYEGLGFEGSFKKIKNFQYFPALTLEDLRKKRVFLVLNTPQFFYEIYGLNLPVYSEDIVRLRLTDRVNTMGFFRGPVSVFWKILKREDTFYQIAYLALESEEILKRKSQLKALSQAKIEGITFLPFSLAKALGSEKEEAFLIYSERGGLWIIIAKEGLPLNIEFLQVDELLGVNFDEVSARLNFLKNLYFRDYQRELKKIVLFQEELRERFLERGFEVEVKGLSYPELIFAPQVEASFNLLPEEERVLKEVLERNYQLSLGMLALSLVLFAGAFVLNRFNHGLEEQIQKKELLLRESINRLMSEYPEEKLRAFRNYLEERERLRKLPSPEALLVKIASSLSGARIKTFEVKEEGGALKFSLFGEKQGLPEEVSTFSQELLLKLGSFVDVKERQFEYSQEESKIIFKIGGIFKP